MAQPSFYQAARADYGTHEVAMQDYLAAGTERANALGNRGPIRFGADGDLHPEIREAYERCGFYVLTGVVQPDELADLEQDVIAMWDNAPVTKGAEVDRHGKPALAVDSKSRTLSWVRPLSDPIGGTAVSHGRHPAKMIEPDAPDDAPEYILQLVLGSLQFSDAALRLYAHPELLRVAAAINGDDFVPFNEAIWLKHPGLGGSVAWHQDGFTHWDNPALDCHTHGFNFMAQLYGCDAANGLWVVPGSHVAKADISAWVAEAGSDRLPDAVPMLCDAGDVGICNRQAVHGSFANTSPNMRVTINFGFHRRASVLGVEGGGIHNDVTVYDEDYIHERSKMIAYGIAARVERFPDETPFVYQPLAAEMDRYPWDEAAREAIRDYNLRDLGI